MEDIDKLAEKFKNNPLINPRTGRNIKENGPLQKILEKEFLGNKSVKSENFDNFKLPKLKKNLRESFDNEDDDEIIIQLQDKDMSDDDNDTEVVSKKTNKEKKKETAKITDDKAVNLKKYRERKSPPVSASQHQGESREGNDGNMYKSIANKNGVYSWKIVK